jgi:hypothetical protein
MNERNRGGNTVEVNNPQITFRPTGLLLCCRCMPGALLAGKRLQKFAAA